MTLMGLLYVWSIFVAPLEYEFGWNRAQTSLTYTISMVCFTIGMMIASYIGKRKSLRLANLIGVCCVGIGFIAVSQTSTLMLFYLFYGMLAGLGIGICYNAWLTTVLSHFPGRTGLASGWLLLGFGIGGIALGPVVHAIVYSPLGWRNAFLLIGVFIFLEGVLAMRVLHPRTYSKLQKIEEKSSTTLTASQTLCEPSFWVFSIWKTILFCTGVAIVGQTAPIMLDMGAEPAVAAIAVSMISAGNSIGRVVTGMFFDRFGYKMTMFMATFMFLGCSIIYWLGYPAGMIMPVNLAMFIFGISYGGTVIITASFINSIYGNENFSSNWAVSNSIHVPAIFILSYGIGVIRVQTGAYTAYFLLMVAFGIISMVLTAWTIRLVTRMNERLKLT